MSKRNFGMSLLSIVFSLTVLRCSAGGLFRKDNHEKIKEGIARVARSGEERVRQLKAMGFTDYDIYGWAKMNNMYVEGINDQVTGVFTGEETNELASLRGAWKGNGPIGWTYNPTTKEWILEGGYNPMTQLGDGAAGMNFVPDRQTQFEAPENIGGNPSQLLGSPTRQVRPFRPNELWMTGRFEEAVSGFKKVLQGAPDDVFAHLGLAATYSMMGREKEAGAEAAEVLRINPKFSLDNFAKIVPEDQSDFIKALRKAGLK